MGFLIAVLMFIDFYLVAPDFNNYKRQSQIDEVKFIK